LLGVLVLLKNFKPVVLKVGGIAPLGAIGGKNSPKGAKTPKHYQ